MDTPFYDQIHHLASKPTSRMHLPAHKGNPEALPEFAGLLALDITEIQGADDLSNPTETLAQSQVAMAKIFGSGATLYSASGCTSCVQAMLTLFVKPGQTVAIQRGCHASAIRAVAFIDANPIWIDAKNSGAIVSESEEALKKSGAKVLYITSPDYYGQIADIAALSEICHRLGAVLLVDNAHGAHLRFFSANSSNRQAQDLHPLTLGADATADSAHKTLPCLTPAALLHLRDPALGSAGRQALNLYCSTSPSYPVLASLDLAAAKLGHAHTGYKEAAGLLKQTAASFQHLVEPCDDPLRLCISPKQAGWHPSEVYQELLSDSIIPEYYDGERIILMASPWNPQTDYSNLKSCLSVFSPKSPIVYPAPCSYTAETVLSIRQALFQNHLRIATQDSEGKVMGGVAAPCPPGVPLVLPGEKITRQAIELLQAGGILQVDVVE